MDEWELLRMLTFVERISHAKQFVYIILNTRQLRIVAAKKDWQRRAGRSIGTVFCGARGSRRWITRH